MQHEAFQRSSSEWDMVIDGMWQTFIDDVRAHANHKHQTERGERSCENAIFEKREMLEHAIRIDQARQQPPTEDS